MVRDRFQNSYSPENFSAEDFFGCQTTCRRNYSLSESTRFDLVELRRVRLSEVY